MSLTSWRIRAIERVGRRVAATGAGALLAALAVAILLLLVRSKWAPLHRLDFSTAASLNRYLQRHPGQVDSWKLVSSVGSPTTFRVLSAVVVIVLLIRRRTRPALFLAVAMIGAAILSGVIKLVVHRARPVLAVPVDRAPGASFPSGHSLTSLVAAGALLIMFLPTMPRWLRPIAIAAAVVVVAAIGSSRVVLGVHFVTDVLGGWLIGAGWLAACVAALGLPQVSEEQIRPATARTL